MKQLFFNLFRVFVQLLYKVCKPFIHEENVIISGYKARHLSGNNEYLFNYLEQNKPSFNYYFYTKDKNTYRKLNKDFKGKILYSYSLRTLIKIIKSKVIVITTGPDDLSPFPLISEKKIINIWHGIPIKKVGYPSKNSDIPKFEKFISAINSFSVSAEFDAKIIKKAFRLTDEKIFISGLCKNDYIKINQEAFLKQNPYFEKKVIIYAPTFRDNNINQPSIFDLFPLKKLNELLEKHDAYFLIRNHFNTNEQQAIKDFRRIKSASAREFLDPQPLLYYSDIMITDYSGIYFDFLLMDRPIIFYNYDMEVYGKKRAFLYDFEENTPGPKVQTQDELLLAIENYLNNPEQDAEFRAKIKKRFHKYTDGKACERTYELIKELL
jgi:CDP-glycerol glycerophosphotransferase